MNEYKEVSTTQSEEGTRRRVATFKATSIVWLILGILETMLVLRFVFVLIGVNPANTFARFLYGVTGFFVAPFATLIDSPVMIGSTFEMSTLIAMVVYILLFWAIERIIWLIFYRPRGDRNVTQTSIAESTQPSVTTRTTTTDRTKMIPLVTPTNVSQTTVTTTEKQNHDSPGTY